MNDTFAGIGGVALVVAITSALKNVGISSRVAPFVAMLIGLALSVGYRASTGAVAGTWFDFVIQGIGIGLSASGLYSGSQTVINGPTVLRENDVRNNDVVVMPRGQLESALTNAESGTGFAKAVGTMNDPEGLLPTSVPIDEESLEGESR